MKAKSAKAKGARLESAVVEDLIAAGIPARRQPGSGVFVGFANDVKAELPDGEIIVECKARRNGAKTFDAWLGQADLLVIRPDRSDYFVYMPGTTFRRIGKLLAELRAIKTPKAEAA